MLVKKVLQVLLVMVDVAGFDVIEKKKLFHSGVLFSYQQCLQFLFTFLIYHLFSIYLPITTFVFTL